MKRDDLIACRECDLLVPRLTAHATTKPRCPRCDALLPVAGRTRLDTVAALCLTALVAFAIAQVCPLVELDMHGFGATTTLSGAVRALWVQGMWPLAVTVACLTIVLPLVELSALLYVALPVALGVIPRGFRPVLHLIELVRPWRMMEVLLLGVGIFVSKMSDHARVVPEAALFALASLALIVIVIYRFDPGVLWEHADALDRVSRPARSGTVEGDEGPLESAARRGLIACRCCNLLHDARSEVLDVTVQHAQPDARCMRCGSRLTSRRRDSIMRTWALLLSAVLLYLPANLLPMMHSLQLFRKRDDTILSGILFFWQTGGKGIAALVFIASIVIPASKLLTLALLAYTTQRRSTWNPLFRIRLFRVVESLGRWSLLDIFVIAVTVSLVHFGPVASTVAGPAAVAYGGVALMTMWAALQFDPRLMWDALAERTNAPQDALAEASTALTTDAATPTP